MKALGILQEGLDFMNKAIEANPNSVKELQSEIDIYNEAILELQVIQDIIEEKDEIIEADRIIFKSKLQELENRSCDSCICWDNVENSKLKTISYCRFLSTGTKNSFYCNEWENKQ